MPWPKKGMIAPRLWWKGCGEPLSTMAYPESELSWPSSLPREGNKGEKDKCLQALIDAVLIRKVAWTAEE